MRRAHKKLFAGLLLCTMLLPGLSTAEDQKKNPDPLEPLNRVVFAFNDTADRYVIRPVAKGYNTVVPKPVRTGVGNFFNNWTYPITIVNSFLQGKFKQGASDTGRFLVNSTVGLLGIFDPATKMNLPEHDEDFGQTFARWGIAQGPYIVLPILGPATLRSGVGLLGDTQINPVTQLNDSSIRAKLVITWFIESRAALVGPDEAMRDAFDPYLFMRDAYLQNRDYLINDKSADDGVFEEEFEDFEDF
jgi:phospholipid-binding lipoprotein MlaA